MRIVFSSTSSLDRINELAKAIGVCIVAKYNDNILAVEKNVPHFSNHPSLAALISENVFASWHHHATKTSLPAANKTLQETVKKDESPANAGKKEIPASINFPVLLQATAVADASSRAFGACSDVYPSFPTLEHKLQFVVLDDFDCCQFCSLIPFSKLTAKGDPDMNDIDTREITDDNPVDTVIQKNNLHSVFLLLGAYAKDAKDTLPRGKLLKTADFAPESDSDSGSSSSSDDDQDYLFCGVNGLAMILPFKDSMDLFHGSDLYINIHKDKITLVHDGNALKFEHSDLGRLADAIVKKWIRSPMKDGKTKYIFTLNPN